MLKCYPPFAWRDSWKQRETSVQLAFRLKLKPTYIGGHSNLRPSLEYCFFAAQVKGCGCLNSCNPGDRLIQEHRYCPRTGIIYRHLPTSISNSLPPSSIFIGYMKMEAECISEKSVNIYKITMNIVLIYLIFWYFLQ
jgi:hypothetical protein